jgi:hypothetical protein
VSFGVNKLLHPKTKHSSLAHRGTGLLKWKADVSKTVIDYCGSYEQQKKIKSEFTSFSEAQFWIRRLVDYPALPKTVLKILLTFPATFECEAGLPTLLQIKTKYRNDHRRTLSSISPRINRLAAVKQAQPVH